LHLGDDAFEILFPGVGLNLAGAYFFVTAATVLEHEPANVRLARSIKDAVSTGKDNILLFLAPHHPDLDILLRIHGVHEKPVSTEDGGG